MATAASSRFLLQQRAVARYFYLPEREGNPAELIVVLNSESKAVQVPMRDEDVELVSFYERGMTQREMNEADQAPTWKIFSDWEELRHDHRLMGVSRDVLQRIRRCKQAALPN